MIEQQEETLKERDKKVDECRKIGDKIYENYMILKDILEIIEKRKTWEQAKKDIESKYPQVVKIDEKKGFFEIDL